MAKEQKQLDGRQEVMLGFAEAAAERGQHFFYVLIPEPMGPMDRGEKYEDPLSDALGELGEVTGGGSQLGEGDTIAFCGLDVVVNDRERGEPERDRSNYRETKTGTVVTARIAENAQARA